MTSSAPAPALSVMASTEHVGDALHRRLGLTDEELELIDVRMGRDPNDLELAIFSVLWSEHCSYKSSKPVLRMLPTAGDGLLAGPGDNAGVISIGDGLAVAFKIESHNHPSAVEPYQGAATGVGGIIRDIVAMGARPIAILDALRFGDPGRSSTWRSLDGVVRGVGGYGNCIGVPTVGGELVFHPGYDANPLVNVMAVGLLRPEMLTRAEARGVGNHVLLYGATTGRDGIGGASVLASSSLGTDDASKRPSVQIGDPFVEKLILEVSLELIERGLVEGLQDLGAGGIACALSEMADRAGTGIVLDLDAVPRREPAMEDWEVVISESQERMCAVVRPEHLDEARAVCLRWGLPSVSVIGRVTDDRQVTVVAGGMDGDGRPLRDASIVGRIPAAALTSEAVVHERTARRPDRVRSPGGDRPSLPGGTAAALSRDAAPEAVLSALLARPGLSGVRWVVDQYDATVGGNTVEGPGRAAAVVRLAGTNRGLAVAVDGNAAVSVFDPYLGAAMSVAQAVRNVAVTGARPLGVTDGLNFGDPTDPEEFWAFREAVRGIADACRGLDLLVVGGNVSFYNASPSGAIPPTPQIGVVGILDDLSTRIEPAFAADNDLIALVGRGGEGLAGSAFAELAGAAPDDALPVLDLAREWALHQFLMASARRRLLTAAQDLGTGGLGLAIAQMALWGKRGARLVLRLNRPTVELFGEGPSRAVIAFSASNEEAVRDLAQALGVDLTPLGATGGDRLTFRRADESAILDIALSELRRSSEPTLPLMAGRA